MRCDKLVNSGICPNEADYRVGLVLRNQPNHASAEAWLGIVVCEEHKALTWADVVSEQGWKQICDSFVARGHAVPSKKHSHVVVRRLDTET